MKNSYPAVILIETIVSILLVCIIVINSMLIFQNLHSLNQDNFHNEVETLSLRSTRHFLEKNLTKERLNQLILNKSKLYFNDSLLLHNVSKYQQKQNNHTVDIELCLNKICESLTVKL